LSQQEDGAKTLKTDQRHGTGGQTARSLAITLSLDLLYKASG